MERRLHSQRKSFRRQLKHKLSESAHTGNFYPTARVAAYWFSRCVANWDNRKTPKGKFDQRVIPHHIPVQFYIELHCKFSSWKEFIETLAHEMVHLYQMTVIKDPYSNHNKNFYAFKNKFKQVGLRLGR